MKHLKIIVTAVMAMCLLLSSTAVASAASYSKDDVEIAEQIVYIATVESSYQTINEAHSQTLRVVEPQKIETNEEYIDYILNGDKEFVFTQTELDINTLLSNSSDVTILSSGNVTGTFESAKMDTGTPYVTWYYTVDYEIEPYSNGYGWRFVDVQGHVYIHKGILLYTWATSCIVTFEEATHSLNSTKTAVTIDIRLKFDVMTEAIYGTITYYEDHSHTTSISNLSPY